MQLIALLSLRADKLQRLALISSPCIPVLVSQNACSQHFTALAGSNLSHTQSLNSSYIQKMHIALDNYLNRFISEWMNAVWDTNGTLG